MQGQDSRIPDGLECDVCVVGSGPAGSTIARELSNTALRVVVLESGGTERQPAVDELNEIENIGWPRRMDQWLVRNRILGGSSHTWWGRCSPFDPIDFEERDWVPYSGWPFSRQDLDGYLDRAGIHLGLSMNEFPEDEFLPRARPDGIASLGVAPMVWRYSSDAENPREPMRFGRRLTEQIGSNVVLVTNSTAVAIRTRPDGPTVEHVEFADRDGRRVRVTAKAVVLCAGGIENARLMLASRVGNDLVGRFLMDHPRGPIARFDPGKAGPLLASFGWARRATALRMRGFRMDPRVQRDERLPNCSSWPETVLAPDDPLTALRRLYRRDGAHPAKDLGTVAKNLPLLAESMVRHATGRGRVQHRYKEVTLMAMCEQKPDRDSRVMLADRTDRFGVPLSRIDWHVSTDEAHTLRRMAQLVAAYLENAGIQPPVPEPWVRDEEMLPQTFTDIAHPTGTTRMARNSALGVVDENCEVHSVGGLFVAGSSTFPTAGHANPTLMIVTLAIRLADHLKKVTPVGSPSPRP